MALIYSYKRTYEDPVKTKLSFVAKHDIECLALIVAVTKISQIIVMIK